MQRNFTFTELSRGEPSRKFDGMAAGTFTSMEGRVVEFASEELAAYVKNTQKALESTKDKNGEIVGLPIDGRNHDHGDAAGWIVAVELSEDGQRILFTPRWTDFGRELIEKDIQRFFSPTVDSGNKVIMGGSLTNWPATRNEAGEILLRPIELSMNMYSVESEEKSTVKEVLEKINKLLKNGRGEETPDNKGVNMTQDNLAEALQTDEAKAKIEELATARAEELAAVRAEEIAAARVEEARQKQHVADFAKKIVGDGVPLVESEISDLMAKLYDNDPESAKQVEDAFGKIVEKGIINFTENGHGKSVSVKEKVPAEFRASLQKWVDAGNDAERFFVENPEVGEAEQYDLSMYAKE